MCWGYCLLPSLRHTHSRTMGSMTWLLLQLQNRTKQNKYKILFTNGRCKLPSLLSFRAEINLTLLNINIRLTLKTSGSGLTRIQFTWGLTHKVTNWLIIQVYWTILPAGLTWIWSILSQCWPCNCQNARAVKAYSQNKSSWEWFEFKTILGIQAVAAILKTSEYRNS